MSGKVHLPVYKDPPPTLHHLLTSTEPASSKFRENIWKYNRDLAFTFLGVNEDHGVNKGRGPPIFRISGELRHRSGALTPAEGKTPSYAQIYVLDSPGQALETRMRQNADLDREIMHTLQMMLSDHHAYVQDR